MSGFTSALIRLYPRAWRQRYEPEMLDLLAAEKPSLRTFADLIAGAIDARLNPQWKPASAEATADKPAVGSKGVAQMTRTLKCAPADVSLNDQWRSAAWMVGGCIMLSLFGVVLKQQIGPNALSEGLLYAAFPASLMLSSECTYFKRYSRAARTIMSVGGALLIIAMMWASVAIGYRI